MTELSAAESRQNGAMFDLHRIGGGVAHEDITVHEIPLAEVVEVVRVKATTGSFGLIPRFTQLFFVAQNK